MSINYEPVGGIGLYLNSEFMQRVNMESTENDVEIFCNLYDLMYHPFSDGFVILVDGENLFDLYDNAKRMVEHLILKGVKVSMLDIRPVSELFVY